MIGRYGPGGYPLFVGRVLDHISCIDVVSPPRKSRYIPSSHCTLRKEQIVAPSRPRQRIITIDPDRIETSAKLLVLNTTNISLVHHLYLKIGRPPSKCDRSLNSKQHCHGHNRTILESQGKSVVMGYLSNCFPDRGLPASVILELNRAQIV